MNTPKNSIRDYYYMHAMNEGLTDLLKGFWEWLTGKYNRDEYDPNNDAFDYEVKAKYINKHNTDSFTVEEIDDTRILNKVVDRTIDTNDNYKGFEATNNFIKKDKDGSKITETNKWVSFVFHGKNLVDNACLVACNLNDPDFPNSVVIYFIEILNEYEKILTNEYLVKEFKEFSKKFKKEKVILKDKKMIKRIKEDEEMPELTSVKDKKGAYEL